MTTRGHPSPGAGAATQQYSEPSPETRKRPRQGGRPLEGPTAVVHAASVTHSAN